MITIKGTGVSEGIAEGPVFYYKRNIKTAVSRSDKTIIPAEEIKRWQDASSQAAGQLDLLAEKSRTEIGNDAALLFKTHRMMLEDFNYTQKITDFINNCGYDAETAVIMTGNEFAEMFNAMDDDYMKARSVDIMDISNRVISILNGNTVSDNTLKKPVIIFADDLTPSETVKLEKNMILGFVLTGGNTNSHTAILARTLGIPAIVNAAINSNECYEGKQVIIDGSTGYAVIDPNDASRKYLCSKHLEENAVNANLEKLKGQPDITADGREIKIYANITSPSDVDAVIKNDARGIGLFRSEFLYLETDDFPDENTQFEAYKNVVQRMNGSKVIIRTMDIGADKKIDYFGLADEENPALGMRALRICLSRPEIFKTQLRALYRASAYGNLAIMFPMVSNLWEIHEVKRLCNVVMTELRKEFIPFDENVELGVMIETPAAVMIAPELAEEVSFFSIGTNDLTQYTIALDRQSIHGLEKFYDPRHPAVLRMIKMTVDAAHKAGIPVGICGELAADCSLTKTFIRMGVDELSVSPKYVLPVRNAVRLSSVS